MPYDADAGHLMASTGARGPKLEPAVSQAADDLVMLELRRHGSRTAAQLVAAVPMHPRVTADRTIALVETGVVRAENGVFTIEGRPHD